MAQIPTKVINRANQAADLLRQYGKVVRFYLFGSYVWGKPDQDSDIDIAFFIEGVESWDLRKRAMTIADIQREVGDDFELHFFPASVLVNPAPASFTEEILQKGILIKQSLTKKTYK